MNPGAFNFIPDEHQGRFYSREMSASNDSRSQIPCRYFLRGQCRKGRFCPYLHEDKSVVQDSTQNTTDVLYPPAHEEIARSINGGLIRFRAGAVVTKVSLPTDFSTLQINYLAPDSTRESVLALLQSQDLILPTEIEVCMTNQIGHSSALVKVEDPEFAKLASKELSEHATSDHIWILPFVATPVETHILSDSNNLQVDCKNIHVSWPKPYRTASLKFECNETAKRVRTMFVNGGYRIRREKVGCGMPVGSAPLSTPQTWTLRLTGVPSEATESDVYKSMLHERDKPSSTEIGEHTYIPDKEMGSLEIRSLFTSIGPLESWELTPDITRKRMKVSGRFHNENDAREATTKLNQSDLPFYKDGKLSVRLVHTATFQVSESIYEAIQSRLTYISRNWRAPFIHLTVNGDSDSFQFYRVLKIESEHAAYFNAAKKMITQMLSARVAKEEDSSVLWHPALSRDGPLFEQLKLLGAQIGVGIIRNKAMSQLRMYGPRSKCRRCQAAIARVLSAEKSEPFSIHLNTPEFNWVLRGGLAILKNAIGSEKINFDITSTPKRVGIIGTADDYDAAVRVLKDREVARQEKPNLNEKDCSVCWCQAENSIQTRCGHIYCLDCFENLCMTSTTKDTATLIQCVGESGSCLKTLSLSELQQHLSSTAFEELLERSFASYVRLNPESLKYCPTVDCGYFYRVSTTSKMRTCPHCLEQVCTSCNGQHGAMTCGDYKELITGGYKAFQKLKKKIGIKDCPRCKTPLEKIEGCNHMTCRCGAHICWVCLKVFSTSNACYDHMNKVHRGIGLYPNH
ncbi:uncharacterized protein GGS22DRAFT_115117 [Annulohypoxylon maeteangense]|uniref:uncharacterized protein n=1 Tax=Annulohypoxylon maeteangense TaxID=1927788 RepID=UPI0020083513|nr:uncharacterized protein GGS22DRAFT_115117 [Annulohypoxylon maeteangense]KAI0886553.1 hypothetical protein GGS22DRAFT_115117 [Annulohypoxylon maeteangense]